MRTLIKIFLLVPIFLISSCGPSYNNLPQARVVGATTSAMVATNLPDNPTDNAPKKVVRIIYLIPKDKQFEPMYETALGNAVKKLQVWYLNQMGNGKTFLLNNPIVETYQMSHDAGWYGYNFHANPVNGNNFRLWNNIVSEGLTLTGGTFNDPNNIWIFFADIDSICGGGGGGGGGMVGLAAFWVANNIRQLRGQDLVPNCPNDKKPSPEPLCFWVAEIGHEAGHTFGLPDRYPAPPHSDYENDSLMGEGVWNYPNTYLTEDDKNTLDQNPFFQYTNTVEQLSDCSDLSK